MITDYILNETDPLDAKTTLSYSDEMKFDPHTRVKSVGDKIVLKQCHDKESFTCISKTWLQVQSPIGGSYDFFSRKSKWFM